MPSRATYGGLGPLAAPLAWLVGCAGLLCACGAWSAEAPARSVSRKIMAGDSLRIVVEEEPTLNALYAVAGDGTIDFGYCGRVPLAELTTAEAGERLEAKLTGLYFRQAHVEVEVAEFVEGAILMMGEVNRPGTIPFRGDQILSLVEAISQSGGLTREAAGTKVSILRLKPGAGLERETILVDVQSMFETLDFSRDQFLRPRDIVIVPRLGTEEQAYEYLALGEVASQGFHSYGEGLDVIRALMRAGGPTREAKLSAARLLRREKDGGYTAIPLDLSRLFGGADVSINIPVSPGDILFLPTEAQASRGQVLVLGEVTRPGAVVMPLDQEVTLAKTILGIGGFTKFANESKVKVLRTAPDGSKQTLFVDVGRILKTGAFEDDVPLESGDVIIVLEKILSL